MTAKEQNDFFYVCSLIEYVARITKNRRRVVVEKLGEKGIRKQLHDAEVNHFLTFEQVGDEIFEWYQIPEGNFDTITNCKYTIPGFMDIGRLYAIMIEDCAKEGKEVEELMKIFTSFISDEISEFRTGLYYVNPDYLEKSYQEGYLLE